MGKGSAGNPPKTNGGKVNEVPNPHPIVAVLQPDLTSHSHLVTLIGYPGDSTIEGHIRIYLHHDLQSYYEILKADIVHHWPPVTEDTTGPINVSIKAQAEPRLVVHTTVSSAAAALLRGDMATSLLNDAIEAMTTPRLMDRTPPPPPPPHGFGGVIRRLVGNGEPVE